MQNSTLSSLGHLGRELLLYPRIFPDPRRKRVAFLPSCVRQMSALLRSYLIAEGLDRSRWQTLVIPKQLELPQRRRILKVFKPDVVVLQTARHPLNTIEHLEGHNIVLDLDDADFHDEAMVDRLTAICRSAKGVVAGSDYVANWCLQHSHNVQIIWTGTPISSGGRVKHSRRNQIVAWAQSDPVYFFRERDFAFSVIMEAFSRCPGLVLRLYGWQDHFDPSIIEPIRKAGIPVELKPFMYYFDYLKSLQDVSVGLSPIIPESGYNRGKSFGKILAYLDAHVPVIASDEADHRKFFIDGSGIISNDPEVWVNELVDLLNDYKRRQNVAENGFALLEQRLSIQVVVNLYQDYLDSVVV